MDVGGWSPDGTYLIVRDVERFAQEQVALLFRHSNWASFLRQLHLHGFRKIHDETPDCQAFKHPDFQRDDPSRIRRIKKRKSAVKDRPLPSSAISPKALEAMQAELSVLRSQIESICEAVRAIAENVKELEQSRNS